LERKAGGTARQLAKNTLRDTRNPRASWWVLLEVGILFFRQKTAARLFTDDVASPCSTSQAIRIEWVLPASQPTSQLLPVLCVRSRVAAGVRGGRATPPSFLYQRFPPTHLAAQPRQFARQMAASEWSRRCTCPLPWRWRAADVRERLSPGLATALGTIHGQSRDGKYYLPDACKPGRGPPCLRESAATVTVLTIQSSGRM
jgi:hypothetical protein